jgi:hypothetical protein
MPGASQISTGGSYGTAARVRGGLPMSRPAGAHPSSQQAPAAAPPFPFTAPWSQTQPSQPEYDQHQGFQIPSGADNSHQAAYGGAGGGFLEPHGQSQPSQTAARLLEELQGRSAPAPTPTPAAEKEDPLPILKEILYVYSVLCRFPCEEMLFAADFLKLSHLLSFRREKLEAFEKKQDSLKSSLEAVEAQLRTQVATLNPITGTMDQVLASIKTTAAKHEKILNEIAVQTSPSLIKFAPLPPPAAAITKPAATEKQTRPHVVPTQRSRPASALVQPPRLFSSLVAEPAAGGKRPRHSESEQDDDDDEEDEVSSRLARRVQRHRQMMAQSKALASER